MGMLLGEEEDEDEEEAAAAVQSLLSVFMQIFSSVLGGNKLRGE